MSANIFVILVIHFHCSFLCLVADLLCRQQLSVNVFEDYLFSFTKFLSLYDISAKKECQ